MKVVCIILLITLLTFLLLYVNLRRDYQVLLNRNQNVTETLTLIQDEGFQELIFHMKQVMSGEIVYELDSENPHHSLLSGYSFNLHTRAIFPTTDTIEISLSVLEITVDSDTAEMVVSYSINYFDVLGELLRSRSSYSAPTIWFLERQEGGWVITEILEHQHQL